MFYMEKCFKIVNLANAASVLKRRKGAKKHGMYHICAACCTWHWAKGW